MSLRTIYYQGIDSQPYHLAESEQLFILRVNKGVTPQEIFHQTKGLDKFIDHITEEAQFVDSRVYVYRYHGSADQRDHIKELIKKSCSHLIDYVGTLFEFTHSHIYQIYTGNIFIKFHDHIPLSKHKELLSSYGVKTKRILNDGIGGYFCEPVVNQHREIFQFSVDLLHQEEVESCHPELVTEMRSTKKYNYRFEVSRQNLPGDWWLRRVNVFEAWKHSKGEGVTVAVIDDGIEKYHPAFLGKIVHPRDMMDAKAINFPFHNTGQGHGTACASIAVSNDPRAYGIAPEAKIMPIRITGLGSVLQAEAIYWAVNHGADIISCSWGPPDGRIDDPSDDDMLFPLPDHTRLAFEYALHKGRNGKGCSIFFAAGNGKEFFSNDGYASAPQVMPISSINYLDHTTSYADYGTNTLCVFPSGDFEKNSTYHRYDYSGILVADRLGDEGYDPSDYYSLFTGTSASCPGVAGVAALIYSINPHLTQSQLKQIIETSCEKVGGTSIYHQSINQFYGHGLLNALLAVQNAKLFNPLNKIIMSNEKRLVSLHIGLNKVDPSYYENYIPPLFGCVNDMNHFGELAEDQGFEVNYLDNSHATRTNVSNTMTRLGNSLDPGGLLLITYAGHGVQLEDENSDEDDGFDESWVLYDGFFLDDEIFNALAEINKEIQVLLISDSCHSEEVTRAVNEPYIERYISPLVARQILEKNNTTVREFVDQHGGKKVDATASVMNFSACLGKQTAKEQDGQGIFTKTLIETFNNDHPNSYKSWMDTVIDIVDNLNMDQTPNITFSHQPSNGYIDGKIFNKEIRNSSPQKPKASKPKSAPRIYNLGSVNISNTEEDINREVNLPQIARSKNKNAWDGAYEQVMQSNKALYTEPNVVSNLYYDGELNAQQVSRSGGKDEDGYLKTYPHPQKHEPNSHDVNDFIWHLGEEFSQLRQANQEVFPLEDKTPSKVRIAHIDTGIINGHPTTPLRYLKKLEKEFRLTYDQNVANDIDLTYGVEQQGHGHGTLSILAGKEISNNDTDNQFQGYFGAAPFVEVFSIRISDIVVLFSGNNFYNAIEYAIENGADVITMSMAGLPSAIMAKAVNMAYESGVVLVTAAGNNWSKGVGRLAPKNILYPARYDRVIAATGATYRKLPYLNMLENERAAGGQYMQSCYGPRSAMKTALAAYTPNLPWFNDKSRTSSGRLNYQLSGGGTSSATPQIAAAAALYIQKYKDQLDDIAKKDKWKKAEIVRQALFQSAEKNLATWPPAYIGQGLLKAKNALGDQYAPDVLKDQITKAKEAKTRLNGIFGILNLFFARSINRGGVSDETKEVLNCMCSQEINQLFIIDPNLEKYQHIDLSNSKYNSDSLKPVLQDIRQSKYASEFLKQQIANTLQGDDSFQSDYITNRFQTSRGEVVIRAQAKNFDCKKISSSKMGYGDGAVYVDEFELEVHQQRSARSDLQANISMQLESYEDKNLESAILLEKHIDKEVVYEWQFSGTPKSTRGRSLSSNDVTENQYVIYNKQNTRGIGFGGKILIKVFSWVGRKLLKKEVQKLIEGKKLNQELVLQKLGEKNYKIKVYDLEQKHIFSSSGWGEIGSLRDFGFDKKDIFDAIAKDKKPVLLVFPGLFSKVEKGLEEFLCEPVVLEKLRKSYARYVIGVNTPTVFHSIKTNADRLDELFESTLVHKHCVVLAKSRGSILARYLFEETWINNNTMKPTTKAPFVLDKLVMVGPPNNGTLMASKENWETLFNMATNVARFTSLLGDSVVPTILSVIKGVGLGVLKFPGIEELDENSKLITELNKLDKINRDNYYIGISNYEPNHQWFKQLLDQGIVDSKIFHNQSNDTIVPVKGAYDLVGMNQANILKARNQHLVNHFNYLDYARNPEFVDRVLHILTEKHA